MKKFTEKLAPSAAAIATAVCILTALAPAARAAVMANGSTVTQQEAALAVLSEEDNESLYTLTVDGSEESRSHGETVQLSAPFFTSGGQAHRFSHWSGDTYLIADSTASDISFTMPQSAVTLNRNYVIVGDINGDGKINSIDSYYLKRMIAGTMLPTLAADINLDGKWDNKDEDLIKRMIMGTYVPTK